MHTFSPAMLTSTCVSRPSASWNVTCHIKGTSA